MQSAWPPLKKPVTLVYRVFEDLFQKIFTVAFQKKVEEIENELSSLADIGRRILSDLEKGSVSRLTAKMLLDVTHDEAIKSDFSPGVMAFVPSC